MLITIRQEIAEQRSQSTDSHDVQWPEFVSDLWTTRLSHFHEETYGGSDFTYDPTTGHYGFQGSSDYRSDKETFLYELENDNEGGNQKQHSNHQDQLSEIGEQERGSQNAQNPAENLAHCMSVLLVIFQSLLCFFYKYSNNKNQSRSSI